MEVSGIVMNYFVMVVSQTWLLYLEHKRTTNENSINLTYSFGNCRMEGTDAFKSTGLNEEKIHR